MFVHVFHVFFLNFSLILVIVKLAVNFIPSAIKKASKSFKFNLLQAVGTLSLL